MTAARGLFAALAVLALAGCAVRSPGPQSFAFAVVGDAPYSDAEEHVFGEMLDALDAEPLDFVVHVGDFKSGTSECSDALYLQRKAYFARVKRPFVLVPGDNDWTDCRRTGPGARDPLERLAKLREVFFGGPAPLGAQSLAGYPENRRWVLGGVGFVTLNLPGSNNNRGFDRASDEEARARDDANLAWLSAAAERARAEGQRGLVVIVHANPFGAEKSGAYDAYRDRLVAIAARLERPVLLVHGDTHWQRVDRPFRDASGAPVANLQRLESYGSPFIGWVRVGVDPADPRLFSFEARGSGK